VLLPGELRGAARLLLGDLPPPTFSVTDAAEDAELHARDVEEIEYLRECDVEGARPGLRDSLSPHAAAAAAAAQRAAHEAAELEALLA